MSQAQADAITASLNLPSINVYHFWVTEQWHTENIYNLLKFQIKGFMCYFFHSSLLFFSPKGTACVMRLVLLSCPRCVNHCLKSDSQGQMNSGVCGEPSSPQQSWEMTGEGETPHWPSRERNLPDEKEWRWGSQTVFCRAQWKNKRQWTWIKMHEIPSEHKKPFFTVGRVVKPWCRLPREA